MKTLRHANSVIAVAWDNPNIYTMCFSILLIFHRCRRVLRPSLKLTHQELLRVLYVSRLQNWYTAEYFCVIEKKPLFKVPTFSEALSIWFATHYVFNLMYSKQTKDVALFFQECVFGLPEPSKGRSATYLTVSSDINKFL